MIGIHSKTYDGIWTYLGTNNKYDGEVHVYYREATSQDKHNTGYYVKLLRVKDDDRTKVGEESYYNMIARIYDVYD